MLVEFLSTITVDKKPFAKNLRIKILPKTHQLRIKVSYINCDSEVPIDIVIYDWSMKFEKLNIGIVIDGREMVTNTQILLTISYDVLKRHCKLTGKIGNENIKFTINSLEDILEIPKHTALRSICSSK